MKDIKIKQKERDAILQSLRAGVVPRNGLKWIQVGRAKEIAALEHDLNIIADGGASIRFIIGEYGSGKTFFLHVIRAIAMKKGLVVTHADLAPDRRLHGTNGYARNLYSELMKNLSTQTSQDGGALTGIIERFIDSIQNESGSEADLFKSMNSKFRELTEHFTGAYDFSTVLRNYIHGYHTDDEELKQNALRWLRAEYTSKTEARKALGVRMIINDSNIYEHLKLMAKFIRITGYKGLLVGIDEMGYLFKLVNTTSRNNNYERMLTILNDSLQGTTNGLGFLMCGTPEFLSDERRGVFSYAAMKSRLSENRFARSAGVQDFTGPVIRLSNLTPEEIFVLLKNLRFVYARGDEDAFLVKDDDIIAFLNHCVKQLGESSFRTPRTTIKAFIDFLSVLDQQRQLTPSKLLDDVVVEPDRETTIVDILDEEPPGLQLNGSQKANSDELARFKF